MIALLLTIIGYLLVNPVGPHDRAQRPSRAAVRILVSPQKCKHPLLTLCGAPLEFFTSAVPQRLRPIRSLAVDGFCDDGLADRPAPRAMGVRGEEALPTKRSRVFQPEDGKV